MIASLTVLSLAGCENLIGDAVWLDERTVQVSPSSSDECVKQLQPSETVFRSRMVSLEEDHSEPEIVSEIVLLSVTLWEPVRTRTTVSQSKLLVKS